MGLSDPGVATLQRKPTTVAEAELADAALAAAGDARAFERLYRAHVARIHSLARRMVDADHADDLTQDVFVRAWEKLATFRGEASFGTWLHRVAVNVILGRRETIGTERGRFVTAASDGDDPTGGMAVAEALAVAPGDAGWGIDFEAAIARLPERARQVFLLHDVAGYRHEEVAELLGIVPGTSKSQLHHARMALREYLER
jgi:RNA polymerase sigma-70 factor (ECF subfamily)